MNLSAGTGKENAGNNTFFYDDHFHSKSLKIIDHLTFSMIKITTLFQKLC